MTDEPRAPETLEAEKASEVGEDQPQAPDASDQQPETSEPEAAEQPKTTEPEADHEAQLEHDLEELAAKAEKADEYLELAKRTKADFENYRKRAARESAAAQERGVMKLALELLPAVDNLDRALSAAEGAGTDGDLVSGIK